jgi:hypothetical protein
MPVISEMLTSYELCILTNKQKRRRALSHPSPRGCNLHSHAQSSTSQVGITPIAPVVIVVVSVSVVVATAFPGLVGFDGTNQD